MMDSEWNEQEALVNYFTRMLKERDRPGLESIVLRSREGKLS
jgi:hypothetical protein